MERYAYQIHVYNAKRVNIPVFIVSLKWKILLLA
jgi:hypothetical protein